MNIEKGIHTQWPTLTALEALLPVARVFTGRARGGPRMPYASINVAGLATNGRGDKSMFREANVRIQVWAEDFDTGKAIQSAVVDGFENAAFDLDDGHVCDMKHEDSTALQEGESIDSIWQFVTVFSAACREDRVN